MPVYKITDKHTNTDVMVEAMRPNVALNVLIADRFEISDGLSAGDAVRLASRGVDFLSAGEEGEIEPLAGEPGNTTRMPLSAFGSVPPLHPEEDDPREGKADRDRGEGFNGSEGEEED